MIEEGNRMELDPDNPVVALCAAGMAIGDPAAAAACFAQAWAERGDGLLAARRRAEARDAAERAEAALAALPDAGYRAFIA
jgi:hypothetical protein